MTDSTCRVAGCIETAAVKKRQLCRKHYQRAWSAGKLDDVAIWRHSILNFDETDLIGSCTECGPGMRVFMRNGRAICWRSSRQTQTSNRHGIPRQALDDAVAAIGNACEVCRTEFSDAQPYCVDHDHDCCPGSTSCGECIRGFLCRRCNVGIGMLADDADRVEAAANYLRAKANKPASYLVNKTA